MARREGDKGSGEILAPAMPQVPPLQTHEVEDFLLFLFRRIGHRPTPLLLRNTAKVARYLQWLALRGFPVEVAGKGPKAQAEYLQREQDYETLRRERGHIEYVADLLWCWLSRWGQVERATKQ